MTSISDIAISGAWDYRNYIMPAAIGVPLVVEAALFAKNIFQKPNVFKEKVVALKDRFVMALAPRAGEAGRVVRNWVALLAVLALMALVAYGCVVLLPAGVAVTSAVSSVFVVGKLALNAGEIKRRVALSTRRQILKAVLIVAAAVAAIVVGYLVVSPMLAGGFSWSVALPLQTKGVVFAEYAALGVVHGALAYRKWKQGDKAGALFHLFGAALSFIFPSYYWNHDMRLHHSFYGLLLMAMPSRALKFFGTLVCIDSMMYMIAPWRGYVAMGQRHEYDFINTVVDNYPRFAAGYAGALIAENVNRDLTVS